MKRNAIKPLWTLIVHDNQTDGIITRPDYRNERSSDNHEEDHD